MRGTSGQWRLAIGTGIAVVVVMAVVVVALLRPGSSQSPDAEAGSGGLVHVCPRVAVDFATDPDEGFVRSTVGRLSSDCEVTEIPGGVNNDDATLSPDGTQIATVHRAGLNTQIIIRAIDGTDPQVVYENRRGAYDPAWSPDGEQISFWRADGSRSVVYVLDLDSLAMRRLSNPFVTSIEPAWDASGEHIAVLRKRQVDVYASDGSGVRTLAERDQVLEFAWSPDGSQMALLGPPADGRNVGGFPVGGLVTIVNPDGQPTGGSYSVRESVLDLGWDENGILVNTLLGDFRSTLTRLAVPGLDKTLGSVTVVGEPDLR